MSPCQRKIDSARLVIVALAMLFVPGVAIRAQAPPPLHDVEAIRAAAAGFARERLQTGDAVLRAEAGNLDPRLRLPACSRPPVAFSPTGELRAAARLTVGVRCIAPAWTVYVPVTVETELAVLVTTRAVPRGASLTAQDVGLQQRRVPGMAADYLVSMEQLAGRHLRAAAAPGTALDAGMLAADVLIRRGQRVTLVAAAGGLEVRAQGEALADSTAEGRVKAMNLDSRKVVEGRAEGRDSVRIGP